ncbi:MAG: hypothetical protein K1Y36_19915 [Blastocatellia bacterium]|nr:hypothetical protein [Blastocatellia bacterium]
MATIPESLQQALEIDGALASALGNWKSGECMEVQTIPGQEASHSAIETAFSQYTKVIRVRSEALDHVSLDDSLEDILISFNDRIHLLRLVETAPHVVFFLVLDRKQANLAVARMAMAQISNHLTVS